MTSLDQLKVGQKALVTGYARQEPALLQRLLEMGLIRGTELKLLRIAPLGDPLEISVRGYKLSVRLAEAKLIEVKIHDS